MSGILLKGDYVVKSIDPKGRVYIRVSRAVCESKNITITMDYHRDDYPLALDDRLHICFARTLDRDGNIEPKTYDHSLYHRDSLMADYEYVMHGKIYDCEVMSDKTVTVRISFGGLLAEVHGQNSAISELKLNDNVFILVNKIK